LNALETGNLARKKKMATPVGAQLDILGDRMIENVYFTYSRWWAWCRCGCRFCFLRAGRRRISCAAGDEGGTFRLGRECDAADLVGQALVASRWSRGMYAAMKCLCFCYLGLSWR